MQKKPRLEIIDCDQGSPLWHETRAGIVTASRIKDILTGGGGATRQAYMDQLAAEVITGTSHDGPVTWQMKQGTEKEPLAASLYAFTRDVELKEIGIALNHCCGASPDRLIGEDGLFEIKCPEPKRVIRFIRELDKKGVKVAAKEYYSQIQTQLWVMQRDWCDLMLYWSEEIYIITRIERDDELIERIEQEIETFNEELKELVDLAHEKIG